MTDDIEKLEKRHRKFSEQASRTGSHWIDAAERAKEELIEAKQEQIEELSDPQKTREAHRDIEELRATPEGEVANL